MAKDKYLVKAKMKNEAGSRIALRDTMKEARKVAKSLDKVAFSRIEIYKICEVCYDEDGIELPEDKIITIKDIKQKYFNYHVNKKCLSNSFRTAEFKKHGKVVVVVNIDKEKKTRNVIQVVRVEDGAELLPEGTAEPCENLKEAVEVAEKLVRKEAK